MDQTIRRIAVIGAGQMGRGIAQVAASAGIDVVLSDVSAEVADKAKQSIGAVLGRLVEKAKITEDDRKGTLDRIQPSGAGEGLGDCDLAVEAVSEQFETKVAIFKATDRALKSGAILASNTSSISITKLARETSRPDRVIGMHFMNPVPLMKLVEIVKGVQTSSATYDETRALSERLGKTVITSNDAPGFMVNRILIPLLCEAAFALQEGVGSAADIDTGAKLGLNHPMGPLELADLIGLDTVLAISEVLHRETGDSKYRAPTNLRNLVAAGWLGKKTGRGFYSYEKAAEMSFVRSESDGPVTTVTINRPDKLNALDQAVMGDLFATFHGLLKGNVPRAVILTGEGKAFVAGADIAAMQSLSVTEARAFAALGHRLGNLIEEAPFPVIAAVNGFALGGGTELALACDFIYASEKAKFGQPEVKLGVIPGFGGTQRLARRVGIGKARELVYTGAIIDAAEALRIGLANEVVAPEALLTRANETAKAIAAVGPLAVAAAKRVMLRGEDAALPAANELEAIAFSALFGSEDQREGMKAFVEKRTATFSGK